MSATETQKTCAELIAEHKAGRFELIGDLCAVMAGADSEACARLDRAGELISDVNATPDQLSEEARERIYELPLGVSSETVFRVELSTGGPADWFEVRCSGDTPRYEAIAGDSDRQPYAIEGVSYHYADWGDHAEVTLSSEEVDALEPFFCAVIGELVE